MPGAYGRFIPRNPEKYRGDVEKIMFRSKWEISVMKFFDSSPSVISWGSEEVQIPYLSPADSRIHMYFPDFFVEYRNKEGKICREIVEVKPLHESDERHAKSERSKDALIINNAKWKAAKLFCESRDMTFRVITERTIFHQGEKKTRKSKVKENA